MTEERFFDGLVTFVGVAFQLAILLGIAVIFMAALLWALGFLFA